MTQTHTESRLRATRREGLRVWVKNMEGLRSTIGSDKTVNGDVKQSSGIIVNNIVVTLCGARWALEVTGESLYKVDDCLTTMLYACN